MLIAGYSANLSGIAFNLNSERQHVSLRQSFLKMESLDHSISITQELVSNAGPTPDTLQSHKLATCV